MSWTFDNKKPIYLQIMEKIKLQIVSPCTGTQSTTSNREGAGERGWCQSQHHPKSLVRPRTRRICLQQTDNWTICD